jgi:hypothetical protein
MIMKGLHAMAAIIAVALGGALGGASAARADGVPTYERDGFPMTVHQVQTLGSDRVHEQASVSTLTWKGMPASPHQLSVLRPKGEAKR